MAEEKVAIEAEGPSHPLFSLHSHRLRICLLLMAAMYVGNANRMSMSVAIVCMVNSTMLATPGGTTTQCQRPEEDETGSLQNEGDLPWSPSEKSFLLSSSFFGALSSIAFSGTIADYYGPARVLFGALSCSALLTLLVPVLAPASYAALVASRVALGVGESFLNPSLNCIAVRWFPKEEKTTLAAFFTSGQQLAAGFGSLFAAFLCHSALFGGWPAIFYIFGGSTALFVVVWRVFVSDTPDESRWTSEEERKYLQERLPPPSGKKPSIRSMPWAEIARCRPLHAIISCSFAFGYSTSIMQAYLPLYLKERLGLPIRLIGVYTMAPFLVQMIVKSFILGPLIDYSVRRRFIKLTPATKLAQSIGSFGASLCLVLFAVVPTCDAPHTALAILIVYGTVYGGSTCGYFTSLLSIAPKYTGTLTSITNLSRMIASCAATTLATTLTAMDTPLKWPILYCSAALFQFIAGCYYAICGNTDIQPWATNDRVSTKEIAR